jgi:pimeloyl-ACP methyl ester carboxylesterase
MTARALSITTADGVTLAGEEPESGFSSSESQSSSSPPVVLLHGLTATRRYVVMGSRTLERAGHRVVAYDARGHGRSTPAPRPGAYGYEQLASDLETVLDACGLERAALAGASMGAQTAIRFALERPERVAALGLITPAFDPAERGADPAAFVGWNALAMGLREGGVEGFVAAYDFAKVPEAWRATVERVVRQRLSAHEHPEAVADALEVVPRSRPFEDFADLAAIAAPTLVVASRDEADPGHPLAVAERYARAIPRASLVVEDERERTGGGAARSPIAWQGGQLSKVLLELLERA